MNELKITSIEAIENNLRVNFECKGLIGRFFRNDVFFAKYDTSIEGVPESILVIPFLSTCLPIVWASNADLYVEAIDDEFLNGLKEIKRSLQNFYPKIDFVGNIHADKIVKSSFNGYTKSMMLFSGGVDSLTTYIRHRSEKPILVSIWGHDVHLDNHKAWGLSMEKNKIFCEKTETELMTIQSNYREINNEIMLNSYYGRYIPEGWYQDVKFGLALTGLCAPITYTEKINKIYIASSYSSLISKPMASHPDIDNNVRWSGTKVEHDGYELSRQEKIEVIADYIQKEYPDLFIRTCNYYEKGLNCSRCEKCSRTITGLELAGIDPNEHGYNINADTFKLIKKKLLIGWLNEESHQFMWKDLQNHCNLDKDFPHIQAKKLFKWLLDIDIEVIRSNSNETKFLRKFIDIYKFYYKYIPYPVLKIIDPITILLYRIIKS